MNHEHSGENHTDGHDGPLPESTAHSEPAEQAETNESRLSGLIDGDIQRALEHHDVVTYDIARTIAALIHDHVGPDCQAQILNFIVLGSTDAPDLRNEIVQQFICGAIPAHLHRWACWLVIRQAHTDQFYDAELPLDGDGLCVYLTHIQPNVPDPDDTDQLIEEFAAIYHGSFGDVEAVVRALSPLDDWEAAIYPVATEQGCREYIFFDWAALAQHIALSWNVIPYAGRYHVFE